MKKVKVLIPAFNEADLIALTVASVQSTCPQAEIIVVDDYSQDNTGEYARQAGATVIRTPANLGKGGAMNFALSQMEFYDVVAFLDGDLGESAGQVKDLLAAVVSGQADMAIAGFPPPKTKGGFGLVKRLAQRGIDKHTGLVFGSPISGQRAMRKEVIDKIGPIEQGYGAEVALTIDAVNNGFTVMEIPLMMSHRESGRNLRGFMHRGRQYRDIWLALWKRR